MAEFGYLARDGSLKRYQGRIIAVDKDEALNALYAKGLLVFQIESLDPRPVVTAGRAWLAFLVSLVVTFAVCAYAVLGDVSAQQVAHTCKLLAFGATLIAIIARLLLVIWEPGWKDVPHPAARTYRDFLKFPAGR